MRVSSAECSPKVRVRGDEGLNSSSVSSLRAGRSVSVVICSSGVLHALESGHWPSIAMDDWRTPAAINLRVSDPEC